MYRFLVFTFFMLFGSQVFADESIAIFVKESSYSIDDGKKLNLNELEVTLKHIKFSQVTLDVDYCAGPGMIANAYVAISNANSSIQDINLVLSGDHMTSKCQDV